MVVEFLYPNIWPCHCLYMRGDSFWLPFQRPISYPIPALIWPLSVYLQQPCFFTMNIKHSGSSRPNASQSAVLSLGRGLLLCNDVLFPLLTLQSGMSRMW